MSSRAIRPEYCAASGRLEPDFDQPPIVTIGGRNAVPSDHPTKLLAALPR